MYLFYECGSGNLAIPHKSQYSNWKMNNYYVFYNYCPFHQVTLIFQPDQREIEVPKKWRKFKGYYKIARHYKWALNETFYNMGHNTVIITEGWWFVNILII